MTNSNSDVYVSLEFTPNPNTLKYSVNRQILERGAMNFLKKEEAVRLSPLAAKFFDVAGVAAVMLGRDFVTVTKTEEGDWDLVHKSCSTALESHLQAGLMILTAEAIENDGHKGGNSDLESRIKEILDAEIRPAVAMDGGDITFDRFEAGVVYLYMQGSCAGCPSSTATLKMGIETRLRQAIPEVLEVVAV